MLEKIRDRNSIESPLEATHVIRNSASTANPGACLRVLRWIAIRERGGREGRGEPGRTRDWPGGRPGPWAWRPASTAPPWAGARAAVGTRGRAPGSRGGRRGGPARGPAVSVPSPFVFPFAWIASPVRLSGASAVVGFPHGPFSWWGQPGRCDGTAWVRPHPPAL
jgi:hypothetical protein